ncbi:MAG: DNA adenine methylase [Treponema sp.]|jgi:adenine-specific DNA-methyltransferase|nr:DNA adenine methylase [Treponema sp.]
METPAREAGEGPAEKEAYLTQQLITYIGNKRALLSFIGQGVDEIRRRLRKDRLVTFDVFSGSGIVARYFKRFSRLLLVNDLERYSALINQCYLSNESELDIPRLKGYYREIVEQLRDGRLEKGILADLYAPGDDSNIKPGERAFYTLRNAMYIDTARKLIGVLPREDQKFFLAPLLSEASIHANTSGVFKGFYKNRETGIGQFGGRNLDALTRIKGDITLPFPVFSRFNSEVAVFNGDANSIIKEAPEADLAYIDPPYNQHPYGSNYFMLNLILDYRCPARPSKISGIPGNWNRSEYNRGNRAYGALKDLAANIKAKYLLLSFNSEGFIGAEEMEDLLKGLGKLSVLETKYNTFRGSRNLNSRSIHVKEYLYLLEK